MPKTKGLAVRQEKFINGVVSGMSYRESALVAGYSPRTANNASKDILKKPIVDHKLTKQLGEQGLDADYVLSNLKKDVDESQCLNPVRTKSLELIGRHLGLFEKCSSEEGVSSSQGVSRNRRDAMFEGVLDIVEGDALHEFASKLRELLKYLPPDKQCEAEKLFNGDAVNQLLFTRVNLETHLHLLAEEYSKKVV